MPIPARSTLVLFTLLVACQPSQPELAITASAGELPEPRNAAGTETKDASITIGTIDTIYSDVLEEDRDLWIYLPRGADAPDNDQLFPVVYLLDGNGHFRDVTGMIYQLSGVNGNKVSPDMVVVGIPNTDRMRDLTPTHTEGTSGGGTAFLDFIENEVIPHVEANYPASQYRTFIGHSLGGLTIIEALVERTELFNNYVAIDPSLWWDDQAILRKAEGALNEMDFSGKSLFVSVANTMRDGMTIDRVRQDTSDQTTHIRSILQFSEAAASNTSSGLNFAWKYYPDDSHGSVPLISEYDAIRFLFPWYDPMKSVSQFFNPELPDEPEPLMNALISHFDTVTANFGYATMPPRVFVNQLASSHRSLEKPRSALALLQFNLSNYPASAETHEALGDYYVWQEDLDAARMHFQHAVERGAEIDVEARLAAEDKE